MIQENLQLGERLKLFGLDLVEMNNEGFVKGMRNIAIELIKRDGPITIDDLRIICDKYDIKPNHSNSYGSIFRSKDFIHCGYRKSKIPSNHARMVSIWGLR